MLIDLVEFPWYSLLLFVAYFLLVWGLFLRRTMPSFFDPLNFGMNLTTAGTLTVYTSMWLEGALQGWSGVFVPIFTCIVLLSLKLASHLPMARWYKLSERWFDNFDTKDELIRWQSGIVFFFVCAALFVAKFGLPILYDNPLHSKMMYSGGDGALRRILQAAALFVHITSVAIYIRRRLKSAIVVYFIASVLVSMLLVSKSALVGQIILLLFLLNVHGESRLNKYVIPLIPIGLFFSLLTIYLGLKSVLPQVEMSLVFRAFTTRVIAFGDASFYALDAPKVAEVFRHDDLFSLLRTNFAALLASLRLVSWEDVPSTGGRIYAAIVGGAYSGIGPNSTLQVEGWLYLGWFGGIYCALSAMAIIFLRKISLIALRMGNAFNAFLGGTIFFGVSQVFSDGSFWGTLGVSLLFSFGALTGIYVIYLGILVLLWRRTRAEKLLHFGGK